jgi:hypothetical protein
MKLKLKIFGQEGEVGRQQGGTLFPQREKHTSLLLSQTGLPSFRCGRTLGARFYHRFKRIKTKKYKIQGQSICRKKNSLWVDFLE